MEFFWIFFLVAFAGLGGVVAFWVVAMVFGPSLKCKSCKQYLSPNNISTYFPPRAFVHDCPKKGLLVLFRERNGKIVPFEESSYYEDERILCVRCQSPTMRYEFVCHSCGEKPGGKPSDPPYPGWVPNSN